MTSVSNAEPSAPTIVVANRRGNHVRIRTKLVALIAVPLVAIAMIAYAGFRSQSVTIETAEDAAEVIDLNTAMDELVLAIGNERLDMIGADTGSTTEDLRATTDAALDALDGKDLTPQLAEASTDARNLVAATRTGTIAISVGMSDANAALLAAAVGRSTDFPSADGYAGALLNRIAILAIEAKEAAWAGYLDSAGLGPDTVRDSSLRFGRSQALLATVEDLVLATGSASFDQALRSPSIRRLAELEAVALDDLGEGTRQLDERQVRGALVDFRAEWIGAVETQGGVVDALVTTEVDAANGARSLFVLLAILGATVMVAVIFVIYRSVTKPLENLMDRADRVAHEELPSLMDQLRYGDDSDELPEATPIPVTTTDEIGELVTAFNDVQLTAYTLATEQAVGRRNVADMFVNLGRRNQQLLHRILNQLTRLEQKEEDPETLRELFELDSAVTRMRRNAESLVALAGGHTARKWSKPVEIDNAVRGALGEVEGYERIEISSLDPARIQGNVVADVTHLMAELLENAINFSESDTTVTVSGHFEGSDYLITILDQGIGMSVDELAENNSRITDPPPLERVPTRFLGLYVVGRLAERHGIGVRLGDGPQRGVVARIQIPAELLGEPADRDRQTPETAGLAARRPARDSQTSPLVERHDVDAELAALPPDPNNDPAGGADTAGGIRRDDGALPTRDRKPQRGTGASRPAQSTPATGRDGSAAADEYTDARSGTVEPAPQPVPAAAEVSAGPGPADVEERLPVRRSQDGAGPPPSADGLPSRGRRKDDNRVRSRTTAKRTPPRRGSLDQRTATDNSEKSAGDFSSMMSALSSGINRGLAASERPGADAGGGSGPGKFEPSKSNPSEEGSEG